MQFAYQTPQREPRLQYLLLVNSRTSPLLTYTDVISKTEAGCLQGIADLKDRYHPCGYGTREEMPPRLMPNGEWQAVVYRQTRRG